MIVVVVVPPNKSRLIRILSINVCTCCNVRNAKMSSQMVTSAFNSQRFSLHSSNLAFETNFSIHHNPSGVRCREAL